MSLTGWIADIASPLYVIYDCSHGGPQGRVTLHHPAHNMAVWLILQGLLDLGGTHGGCVESNPGTELSDDLTHGPHV